ncbi:uncharacterized protein LOC128205632 isoform X2 [Mya arenaria]|nr:uncharacterized protein LOC128205632 isoform X2 [Mya arenaria]
MCLRLLEYIKGNKPPVGVMFDKTKVTLSRGKTYKEGQEYDHEYVQKVSSSRNVDESEQRGYAKEPITTLIKKFLGKGIHGDILVVRDRGTNAVHAEKTIMISHINPNEIRCWVTLMETGYVPQLYMFRIDGDAVVINMESLETAKTLEEIINEENLRKAENADLLKPFSLYVLDGALEALCDMHNKEWAHNDLHGGNVMLDNELKIKIIDFGCVSKIEDSAEVIKRSPFQHDIRNAVRLFTAIFCGQYFESIYEFETNSHARIDEAAKLAGLPNKDKELIFAVIDQVLKITNLRQLKEFKQGVNDIMRKEMGDSHETIRKKVAVLLFPDKFHDLHQEKLSAEDEADRIDDEADCIEDEADCIGDEEECIGAEADYIGGETFALLPDLDLDSVAAKITDQQINELCRQCGLSL